MKTTEVRQEEDGTWSVTVTEGDKHQVSSGWPNETMARLVAYQVLVPTPIRSHRVGGGYR